MAALSPIAFFVVCYLLTVALEAPVLWWGLARHHGRRTRLLAIFGLTAATYPGVVLVLPPLLIPRFGYAGYVVVAELFAVVSEVLLFRGALTTESTGSRRSQISDAAVIVAGNTVSFVVGTIVMSNNAI